MASIGLQRLGPLKGHAQSRLWMSTPKRLAKRAVDRNLVKRVLRAQWRQHAISQEQSVVPAFQFLAKLQTLPNLPRAQKKHVIAADAANAFNESWTRALKSQAAKAAKP